LKKGSLVVVGSGILTPAHLSQESIGQIKAADVVYLLIPDALGFSTIKKLNSNIKNLAELYYDPKTEKNGTNRLESYDLMVESILFDVRKGLKVCAIFYGHPGVFVYPSHVCIKKAVKEGYKAKMLPAISAEDCLFADLGIDPGDYGCQAYEASQYLFYKHKLNTSAALILWQIGVAGDVTLKKLTPYQAGLSMLKEKLSKHYPLSHIVTLYEASRLPIMPPRIETTSIGSLNDSKVNTMTTLYVPPLQDPELDSRFCDKWNIDTKQLML